MDAERCTRDVSTEQARLHEDLDSAMRQVRFAKSGEYTERGGIWASWIAAHDALAEALGSCMELAKRIVDVQQQVIQAGAECVDAPKGKK